MPDIATILVNGLFFACGVSLIYLVVAIVSLRVFAVKLGHHGDHAPPVTLVKPLCGMDAELYENLRSFCLQDYPEYQIVFGVHDMDDPAVSVIKRLIAEFPDLDMTMRVEDTPLGANGKVSNIASALRAARHDIIVVVDSDMRVSADYLGAVAASFSDPAVGAATCLYKGIPHGISRGRLASHLGAMFINEWFLPSVLVNLSYSRIDYCFGATMAIRRDVLEGIGGIEGLANELADDHHLGKKVAALGYQVALVPYVVENIVHEPDFEHLYHHELRWARTVRSVQPWGFMFSVLTDAVPLAVIALLVSGFSVAGWSFFAAALTLRVVLHYAVRHVLRLPHGPAPWLIPLRDALRTAIWMMSFTGRRLRWRSTHLTLADDGMIEKREDKVDEKDPVPESPLL